MRKIFLVPVILLTLTAKFFAQPIDDDLPQITGCIALINARIVTSPGNAPVTSHLVMRNGLITHLGSDIKIPADAYRIAADSFYVYPAFIDAFSHTGIKEPEDEGGTNQRGPGNRGVPRPSIDSEGNLPLEDAGITPYKSVRATFDAKEKSISDWRAQGFAVAHVVPKGKMLPGKGAVVVLSGKENDQMLWREDVSMYGQWTGAGGGYPATVIGVMAKWRELYHNATQAAAHKASYNNASLVSRPTYNQAHESLIPVVKKEMQVYFRAPKVKDISRALTMQEDLGMQMVIAGAEEAWYLKDKFKSGAIPLVLSLDLPEDKAKDKAEAKEGDKAKAEAEAEVKAEAKDSIAIEAKPLDPEKEAFEKKRAESLKAYLEQAGVLAKEGIAFSFGTMNLKTSDFSKNITTMIENGLSSETALKALTTQPAKLLGIDKYCGTVEVGKMANVIITTKPLFEKESAIRYMIVEGNLYAYEIKEKKKTNGKSTDVTTYGTLKGTWSYEVDVPGDKEVGTFEFTNDNGVLAGIITNNDITTGNNELEDIVIDGQDVSFVFDMDMGGQMVQLEFDLKITDESFSGIVAVGDFGSFPINGNRTAKPN